MRKKFRELKSLIRNNLHNMKLTAIDKFFELPFLEKPFPNDIFGKKPLKTKQHYLNLHKKALKNQNPKVAQYEEELGFLVNNDWFNDISLVTQTCIKNSPLNFNHGKILYTLVSKYIQDHKKISSITILETGTARGFSSLCMSKAINDQDAKGKIITIDCISHNQKMYWNCITDFAGKKTRQELLSKWNEEISNIIFVQGWTINILERFGINRVHFAFLDAQHTREAVLKEFEYINKRQEKGDIIFFDDVTPNLFDGVCDAVKYIGQNYSYKIKILNFDKLRGYALAIRI